MCHPYLLVEVDSSAVRNLLECSVLVVENALECSVLVVENLLECSVSGRSCDCIMAGGMIWNLLEHSVSEFSCMTSPHIVRVDGRSL